MSVFTRASIIRDLVSIGLAKSDAVLVHTSFRSIGPLIGGPQALVSALQEVVRRSGTIVMPTQSGDLTDPSGWVSPPVDESCWEEIRNDMIGYHPRFTPTRRMGIVPEVFRQQKGVVRSRHPSTSFAAWGKHARLVTRNHPFDFPLGRKSPLEKLYDLDALILLIGVGHDKSTFLHLAEHRLEKTQNFHVVKSPLYKGRKKRWISWKELNYYDEDFMTIGISFELRGGVKEGTIGNASARLMRVREYVDFACDYMEANR